MSEIVNFYENKKVKKHVKEKVNPGYANTQIKLNSKIMIVGSSGSGKTQTLLNYIYYSPHTFAKIIICSKGITEALYEFLKEEKSLRGKIMFHTLETMPTVNDLKKTMSDPDDEYLIVFDDIVNDLKANNPLVSNYYICARKCNMTTLFLTQSFYRTPKVVRGQLDYLILLKVSSKKDLKLVLSDFALGIEPEELVDLHRDATREQFSFLKIDVNNSDPNKKFSRLFNLFYEIGDEDSEDSEEEA